MTIQIFTLAQRESLLRDLEWRFVIVHYSSGLSGSLGEDLVCEKAGRGDFPEIEGSAAIFAEELLPGGFILCPVVLVDFLQPAVGQMCLPKEQKSHYHLTKKIQVRFGVENRHVKLVGDAL